LRATRGRVWEAFQRNLREQSKKKGRTNFKAADTGTTPDPDSPDPLTIKRYFLKLDKSSDPSGSLTHLTPWPGFVIRESGINEIIRDKYRSPYKK